MARKSKAEEEAALQKALHADEGEDYDSIPIRPRNLPTKLTDTDRIEPEPRGPAVSSCRDEIVAMRLFEADSTASARLTKLSYLKLYNRLKVRRAVDLLFQAYDANPQIVQKPVLPVDIAH